MEKIIGAKKIVFSMLFVSCILTFSACKSTAINDLPESLEETNVLSNDEESKLTTPAEDKIEITLATSLEQPTTSENSEVNGSKENYKEIEELATNFSKAWFKGNGLEQYLVENYEGDIDYKQGNSDEAIVNAIKGLEDVEGQAGVVWIEFKESNKDDTYKYLTLEVVREGENWKVQSYGVEM